MRLANLRTYARQMDEGRGRSWNKVDYPANETELVQRIGTTLSKVLHSFFEKFQIVVLVKAFVLPGGCQDGLMRYMPKNETSCALSDMQYPQNGLATDDSHSQGMPGIPPFSSCPSGGCSTSGGWTSQDPCPKPGGATSMRW